MMSFNILKMEVRGFEPLSKHSDYITFTTIVYSQIRALMVNKQTNQIASLINLFSLLQTEAQNVTYYNRTRNQRIGDAGRILASCYQAAKAKVFVSCLSVIFKLVTLLRSRNLRAVVIHRAMPVESNNTPAFVLFIITYKRRSFQIIVFSHLSTLYHL